MPSGMDWLAGLGAGASSLGNSLNERALLEQQEQERAAKAALERLVTMRSMGAVEDTDTPIASDFEDTLRPGSITSGGGALGALVEAAKRSQSADRFTLPNRTGGVERFRIDEAQTPQGRQDRQLQRRQNLEQERKRGERDELAKILEAAQNPDASISGPARARAAAIDPTYLDKFLTPAKTEQFTGQPFSLGAEGQQQAGEYMRGSNGSVVRIGASPQRGDSETRGLLNDIRTQSAQQSANRNYLAQPAVADAFEKAKGLRDARTALASSRGGDSGIGDLMALYAVIKVFDPNAVRGEEIKLVRGTNSLAGRAALLWDNTARGSQLSESQRAQIRNLVDDFGRDTESKIKPTQSRYRLQAARAGQDSLMVAPSPFEGLPDDTSARPASPAGGDKVMSKAVFDALSPQEQQEAMASGYRIRP